MFHDRFFLSFTTILWTYWIIQIYVLEKKKWKVTYTSLFLLKFYA